MSQLTRVAKYLRRNNTGKGISAVKLAYLTDMTVESVAKRVSDLRNIEGHNIYSNYRTVKGKRKLYYRFDTNKEQSTDISRVAKYLRQYNTGSGISVAKLAQLANVTKETVHKRVSDLRNVEGHTIYSNFRIVNGVRKMLYRIAA